MGDLQSRTRYEPAEAEPRILARWLESGLFHPPPEGTARENFSIAVPPPNVTGVLHMGHALNGAIQDTLIRLARMRGQRAKWILGTDHAGIATQRQVEKRLEAQGTSREALGRERFAEAVWAWREEFGGQIIEQFKRLGASLDYADERFTLDAGYARAVLEVFVALYEQGLIYRDHRLVNWDPGLLTAVSDLEVEEREVEDTLFHIAYPLAGGGEIVVATVRPETMLADTAVAVNPHDERYAHLVGSSATLPLVGRELPIIADEHVRTDFGTGALKITPGHDPNDFEIGRRHGLDELTVIGEDGRMTAQAGERFSGLTVAEAQAAVLAALREDGTLRAEEPYLHVVPFSERSGARIEPLISLQWFMRMDELAGPAADAVCEGRVRIHPESQARRYLAWLEEIRPWCISRQLWWGHQIPVWYRGKDEVHVGHGPPEGEGWERDPDVLDTWFSSALWPFATLGWPEADPRLRAFYPTDVLSTAREILFLWVARMVMMGLRFTGEVPFTDVYIHSVIQAPDGRPMKKSLGTGIDPLGEIERDGADAVRFGLLAMSSTQDVRYSAEKVGQGRALATKLFNAVRFALLNVAPGAAPAPRPTTLEDRWILSRLRAAKADFAGQIERFDFAKAALGLYDFVYGELCDWYLEFTKGRDFDDDLSATVLHVFEETLKLAHPIMPFVTEELWELMPGQPARPVLLAAARVQPEPEALADPGAEAQLTRVIAVITALRRWRDEAGVRRGAVLPVRADAIDGLAPLIERLAKVRFETAPRAEAVATVTADGMAVDVLPTEEVDTRAAERRVAAQRATLEQEIARAQNKLANQGFVAKAPPDVVEAERHKLARLRVELEAL
ncbi:MAG TPA: valine--tRNA ligase [Solirubrobacteraceae bacterium]|nr:valine--tRNA ligase [Solirubrobacteraceae bacterium]